MQLKCKFLQFIFFISQERNRNIQLMFSFMNRNTIPKQEILSSINIENSIN
jgi:hypothetical protein